MLLQFVAAFAETTLCQNSTEDGQNQTANQNSTLKCSVKCKGAKWASNVVKQNLI